MKPKEKDEVMLKFKAGELDVLVSTTVIEVIDLADAGYGLKKTPERIQFVGAASAPRTCRARSGGFLLHPDFINLNDAVKGRLRFLCHTSDGFAVAKYDLENRGPSDFFGSAQHGLPTLRVADLVRYPHADSGPGGSQGPAGC